MSLGILNNISAVYAENNLNNSNNSLTTVLQQLSSGSKINSGADDAAGLSLVDGLQANQTALTQSVTNAKEGVGLLQVADGALSQVTSLLNRAVTLATEASNGTLNSSQDQAANQEYQSILSEISNIGSTTTYNQNQVFNSNTNIYTGDATMTGSSIDALNIRTLSSSNVGDTGGVMAYSNGGNNVFLNLSSSTANAQATDTLNGGVSGTTTINVNYLVKGANGAETTATTAITVGQGTSYTNTANGLMSAINGAGLGLTANFATQAQAGVQGGGTQTGIEITGGLVSVGMDPSSASTSGVINLSGTAANELLTQGQSITLKTGNDAAVTVAISSSVDSLQTLAGAIASQDSDVNATVITNGDGSQSLFIANKNASAGALTVTPSAVAAAPIGMAFSSGATGATGGFATGSLSFGSTVASSASQVVAGSIVLSNSGTPGANPITFVMGAGAASGPSAGTVSGGGSTFTVNGNTLGNLATAISAELGVTATVGSTGISMTSNSSGTTIEAGTNALTATPGLAQTSNVSGVNATFGTNGSTTLSLNAGVGAVAGDALTGSIVLTNGNATTPGSAMTFVMGSAHGKAGNIWTTNASTVTGLINEINNANADGATGMSAALNGAGQIVLTSNTVGTTIAVSSGAANNTLSDTPAADPITGTLTASTPSAAAASTGATVATGVSEINGNPLATANNDTLSGSIVLNNGTTAYTFVMGGNGAAGSATQIGATHGYTVGGSTLSDLQQAVHSLAAGTTHMDAALNTANSGLTFSSTANGESISVDSSGLSTVSTMSFTTPASGSTAQYQAGVMSLTDGGQLPGSGGASTGTLTGSITVTNNGVTDTFVMGGSSETLAADNGTIQVNGSTLNALISAINDESARIGSNLNLSASQDGASGGLFVQSTAAGATDLAIDTSALTNTLSEASTNGTNGAAGATTAAAHVVFSNGGTNAGTDVLDTTSQLVLTNTSASAVVYGGAAVTFAVGTGNAAHTIYTGNGAGQETLQGLADAINSVKGTYNLSATISSSGLTVTSLDNTSTILNAGSGLVEDISVSQSGQTGGASATNATYANAAVGISGGTVGASDALSGSIVLNNNAGTAQTFVMGGTANVNGATITTGGYTLQNLADAINSDSGNLHLNASVANGILSLQSTSSGVDTIVVGTGAGDTLADAVTATASGASTGAPGAKSTATLNLAGGLSTAASGDTLTGSIALTGATGTKTFVMGGTNGVNTIGVGSAAGGETLGALAAAISNSGIGVTAAVTSNGLSLTGTTNNAVAIAGTSTLYDGTSTAALSYTPTGAYNVGISNSTGAQSLYDSSTGQNATGDNEYFASNTNSSSGIATISYSDGAGQSLVGTDLLNQTDAESALNDLNLAISDVAAQDGYIGAQINTLNSISQVMSTQQENVVSAQNAIQATDYASATSNMSKYEILSQTGISALAQANSMQQEVTKLLQ